MRKVLFLALLSMAGCQSVVSPLEPRRPERADDPLLSTGEQQRKARYLHAFTDEELAPRSSRERPEPAPHNR
jgi:hypothetical protein